MKELKEKLASKREARARQIVADSGGTIGYDEAYAMAIEKVGESAQDVTEGEKIELKFQDELGDFKRRMLGAIRKRAEEENKRLEEHMRHSSDEARKRLEDKLAMKRKAVLGAAEQLAGETGVPVSQALLDGDYAAAGDAHSVLLLKEEEATQDALAAVDVDFENANGAARAAMLALI